MGNLFLVIWNLTSMKVEVRLQSGKFVSAMQSMKVGVRPQSGAICFLL